tara:strand:- start:86132 stop:86689 length:558 start_codon:yes stop_codon:yes gene_type:complete
LRIKKLNQYRIIGGKHRGRKLGIPDIEGVRPTSDRIRETVFNWLAPHIIDSVCLDAFAGSGALGFEAASRGAQQVTLFDVSQDVVNQLSASAVVFADSDINIQACDFLTTRWAKTFDIIFLDPPFNKDNLSGAFEKSISLLSDNGLIYLECEKGYDLTSMVNQHQYELIKHKTTGNVQYGLGVKR